MGRPHVTLKLATSLDGRIATASGESRWITGEAARAHVHRMRGEVDAVMVGIQTALADDPELTVRTDPPPPRQPLRVVLDRRLRMPPESKLVRGAREHPTVVISTSGWPSASPLDEAPGVVVKRLSPAAGESELGAALGALASDHGVGRVLVEGGGAIAAALLKEGLVDRLEWFRAPILLGAEGRPAIGGLALSALEDAPRWRRVALTELGPDLLESYERA